MTMPIDFQIEDFLKIRGAELIKPSERFVFPLSVIKEMMGHESEETTEIYTNEFGDNVLSKYSDLLDIE